MTSESTSASGEASESVRHLIVGLGNPGARYRDTRHNYGFRVVDELARRLEVQLEEGECHCRFARHDQVDLAQPQTYMNRSGYAVRCLAERWGYPSDHILVIYDEVALPLGRMRLRSGGSPAGHRGMESVVENLRTTAVPRLRLGIAPGGGEAEEDEARAQDQPEPDGSPRDLTVFVLEPFDESELETVESEIRRAADASLAWLRHGAQTAMNRFNG